MLHGISVDRVSAGRVTSQGRPRHAGSNPSVRISARQQPRTNQTPPSRRGRVCARHVTTFCGARPCILSQLYRLANLITLCHVETWLETAKAKGLFVPISLGPTDRRPVSANMERLKNHNTVLSVEVLDWYGLIFSDTPSVENHTRAPRQAVRVRN